MTQRVNIQYSVDIQDLPGELERMAKTAIDKLAKINLEMEMCPANMLSLETHDYIDSIRIGLSDVDAVLGDINNIIQSYVSFKAQQLSDKPMPPVDVPQGYSPNGIPIPEELSDLHEKLAQFKQTMGNVEVTGEITD